MNQTNCDLVDISDNDNGDGDQTSNEKMTAAKTSGQNYQHKHRKLNNSSKRSSSSNIVSGASLLSQTYKIKNRDSGKAYNICDCLHLFCHPDAVICVSFYIKEDRYSLPGGSDKKQKNTYLEHNKWPRC